jgi:hypothetical protein
MKDFSHQKRTSSILNNEFSSLFSSFWRFIFALLDPDLAAQNQCGSIRIWIHNIEKDKDFWFTTATYCKPFSDNWINYFEKWLGA